MKKLFLLLLACLLCATLLSCGDQKEESTEDSSISTEEKGNVDNDMNVSIDDLFNTT